MAKKFKKKTIAIIGVIAGALLGYGAIGAIVNQPALYGVVNGDISEAEKSAFNSRFTAYQGIEIKGSNIKHLIQTIISQNIAYIDEYDKIVEFNGISNVEELRNIRTTISTSKTYNISCEYTNEGYINNIICEEVKQ